MAGALPLLMLVGHTTVGHALPTAAPLELFVDMHHQHHGLAAIGSRDHPFLTLGAAQAAVRALPLSQRCNVTVSIAGGLYGGGEENNLRLTEADSGCAGASAHKHPPCCLLRDFFLRDCLSICQ